MFKIILILYFYFESCVSWHGYIANSTTNSNCIDLKDPTKSELILTENKIRLWPGLLDPKDVKIGETLYGFREAIDIIYKNQHPKDCSKARFLVTSGWQGGFGSEVHVLGSGLALAIELGRVYLSNPGGPVKVGYIDNSWQVRNSYCSAQKKFTIECYFEPWSSCTLADIGVKTEQDIKHPKMVRIHDNDFIIHPGRNATIPVNILKKVVDLKAFVYVHTGFGESHQFVPHQMKHILDCSPMNPSFDYYWWRAISAAYILRPNKLTLKKLESLRTLPLQPQEDYLSMYVRRGDKHVEMQLVDLKEFWSTAALVQIELMKLRGQVAGLENQNNNTSVSTTSTTISPILFLASESPSVIEQGELWGKNNGWRVLYTTLFDREKVSAHLDYKALKALRKSFAVIHHDLEYLSMLLTLDYATRSQGWVCTLASNYCRVIDELRATVGGKANFPFADLSKETCSSPPCINDYKITNFDWRMRQR